MRKTLAGRLPGMVVEAFLIVFAVLAALAVDEYWEGREEQELADVALDRITSEIRNNRAEILTSRDENLALRDRLTETLDAHAATGELEISRVNYDLPLLGADAWETARVTRAVHFIDFDRVSRISEAYRIQQLYLGRQEQVVANLAGIGGNESQLIDAFRSVRGELSMSLNLECHLVAAYDSLLAELDLTGNESGTDTMSGCGQP